MKRRDAVAALIVGLMIVLALMAVFAIELSGSQAKSKRDVEARVHERSVLAGALIDSLFQSSARSSLAQDVRLYGAPRVSDALLERNRLSNRYLVLVGASGDVLAHSRGFTRQARADLATSAALTLLRAGHPWAVGNVLPYGRLGVINYGLALPTPAGTRYLLTGFSTEALGPFLSGELRQIPGVKGANSYVLDANGVVLASTNPARPSGYVFHTSAQLSVLRHSSGDVRGHYFDEVRLANTTWRIVLAAPGGLLFASVSRFRRWLPWLIFIAFGIVAIVALILARRVLRSSDLLSDSNAQLSDTNAHLADANAQLETVIGSLAENHRTLEATNAALDRHARELARSNAELDQFASIASHDLQEPLRKVRTFTERIVETEGENLSERGVDYLMRANASAVRMQRLIEDLLKFSRVGTQGREFTSVHLAQVARDVLDDLEEQVRRMNVVVRLGDLPMIAADATQMRQLIQNLVSNAIKFRRDGVRPEIDIDGNVDGNLVTLTVRDNGIGFEPRYSGRIFRIFERLHDRQAYPGTGIGLALCRKIAERHGGTVVASSVPGVGSTFTVTMNTTQNGESFSEAPPGDDPHGQQVDQHVPV